MKIRFFTIPNLLTLCNLVCGSLAVLYALRFDNLHMAFILIVAGAVFDFFDGFAARLLGSYSELGKQLDSLADMISFGLAPSAILFSLFTMTDSESWIGFTVFIVAAFSALRLAKFNIDENQSSEFIGLPTPANALLIGAIGYLYNADLWEINPYFIIVLAVVMSFLLISPIRMFALKFHGFGIKGNEIRYGFMALSLISLILFAIAAIPFIIVAYILLSGSIHICSKFCKRAK